MLDENEGFAAPAADPGATMDLLWVEGSEIDGATYALLIRAALGAADDDEAAEPEVPAAEYGLWDEP